MSDPSGKVPARDLPAHLFAYELAGFLALIVILWMDEMIDLPFHFLGATISPPRWQEALFESCVVAVLGTLTLLATRRLTQRVVHLESYVVLCAWCRRVKLDRKWVSIEEFLAEHQSETTHGLCDDCGRRVTAETKEIAGRR